MAPERPKHANGNRLYPAVAATSAWMVHLLTASGAVFGLLAVMALHLGRPVAALWWMAVTVAIDAVDGTLARKLQVKKRVPQIDGSLLDNVVDYFTWAIVPACFILMGSLLDRPWHLAAAAVIALCSTYQFARVDAKTGDHTFGGFPSYWNILVLYLFLFEPPQIVSLGAVFLCGAACFFPLRFLYPSRTSWMPGLNLALSWLWGMLLLAALVSYPRGHRLWAGLSLIYVGYYLAVSLWITWNAFARTSENNSYY